MTREELKRANELVKETKIGHYAIRETGFMADKPVSSYTCVECIDKWLDEINDN